MVFRPLIFVTWVVYFYSGVHRKAPGVRIDVFNHWIVTQREYGLLRRVVIGRVSMIRSTYPTPARP